MKQQLEVFRTNLEEFAVKHRKEISKNPVFRNHFQQMCSKIGVDPLQSNKGFWAEILGVGDFYYELGVQIVDVCIATRAKTGGLIELEDLKRRIERMRGKSAQEISTEDIVRSIRNLKPLGSGYDIIKVGSKQLVQSVPREVSNDFSLILSTFQEQGHFTWQLVLQALSWSDSRIDNAIVRLF